ncbi:MAG: VCBS repeat-containing protein [Deltaproteobacteria bacterium]|nr:VCBS repeat-containing protein [Deltaproteobacteria bacterium]
MFDAGGEEPSSISIGDVDADGDLDVAVATRRQIHVSVVRNNGGNILPPLRVASSGDPFAAEFPSAPTLADLDGDGAADLVWASGTKLHVLRARP